MAKRTAKFTVTRALPEWYWRKMFGGRHHQTGVVGQVSYVEVYNSSTSGGYLYIWAVRAAASAGDELIPEWYTGKKQNNSGGQASLFSGGGAGYGLIGGFTNPTCVGTEIGDCTVLPTTDAVFTLGFPLAIIRAGDSFGIHTAGANEILNAGVWWMEAGEL